MIFRTATSTHSSICLDHTVIDKFRRSGHTRTHRIDFELRMTAVIHDRLERPSLPYHVYMRAAARQLVQMATVTYSPSEQVRMVQSCYSDVCEASS